MFLCAEGLGDAPLKGFVLKFKDHLLDRFLGRDYDPWVFTEDQQSSVWATSNRIYSSRAITSDYTTYDIRPPHDQPHSAISS